MEQNTRIGTIRKIFQWIITVLYCAMTGVTMVYVMKAILAKKYLEDVAVNMCLFSEYDQVAFRLLILFPIMTLLGVLLVKVRGLQGIKKVLAYIPAIACMIVVAVAVYLFSSPYKVNG